MPVKTILNRLQKYPGFVYGAMRLVPRFATWSLEVEILPRARSQGLKFVCSDLWQPYLKVVAKKAGQALHVLDRFHIMMHFSKAIDLGRPVESGIFREGTLTPHRRNANAFRHKSLACIGFWHRMYQAG